MHICNFWVYIWYLAIFCANCADFQTLHNFQLDKIVIAFIGRWEFLNQLSVKSVHYLSLTNSLLILAETTPCHSNQNILTNEGIDRTNHQVQNDSDQPKINTHRTTAALLSRIQSNLFTKRNAGDQKCFLSFI